MATACGALANGCGVLVALLTEPRHPRSSSMHASDHGSCPAASLFSGKDLLLAASPASVQRSRHLWRNQSGSACIHGCVSVLNNTLRLWWGSLSKSMSKSNSSLYLRIQIIDSFVLHLQHILGVNTVLDDLGLLLLLLSRHQVYFHLREERKCSQSFHVYLLEGLVGQAGLPLAILQPRARRPSAPAGCRRRAG